MLFIAHQVTKPQLGLGRGRTDRALKDATFEDQRTQPVKRCDISSVRKWVHILPPRVYRQKPRFHSKILRHLLRCQTASTHRCLSPHSVFPLNSGGRKIFYYVAVRVAIG